MEWIYIMFGFLIGNALLGAKVDISQAVKEWNDNYRSGHEINITKLPPDVKIIRAFNSQ